MIIGAGAAGLATAACLRRAGSSFVILEQEANVGAAWGTRYDRLHLHTSKGLSGLPFHPFGREVPRYPSRDEVVAYLQGYAAQFDLAPRFGERVTSIRRSEDGWLVSTDRHCWRASNVVVATGNACTPHVPTWPGIETFGGPIIHSGVYRNGKEWAGRLVLVVGIGNSGGEIAVDLVEHGARPSIVVRSPVNIVPRDFLGIPILGWALALAFLPVWFADAVARVVSWIAFGSLHRLGLRRLPYGAMSQIERAGRIPLIDVGTVAMIRDKRIEVLPDILSFSPGTVRFRDGEERAFDAVVVATGFRTGLEVFVDDARSIVDAQGFPKKSGSEVLPGLYLCGFRVAPTGMLREIRIEAMRVAASIAGRAARAA